MMVNLVPYETNAQKPCSETMCISVPNDLSDCSPGNRVKKKNDMTKCM